jgi:hypothetical protein
MAIRHIWFQRFQYFHFSKIRGIITFSAFSIWLCDFSMCVSVDYWRSYGTDENNEWLEHHGVHVLDLLSLLTKGFIIYHFCISSPFCLRASFVLNILLTVKPEFKINTTQLLEIIEGQSQTLNLSVIGSPNDITYTLYIGISEIKYGVLPLPTPTTQNHYQQNIVYLKENSDINTIKRFLYFYVYSDSRHYHI